MRPKKNLTLRSMLERPPWFPGTSAAEGWVIARDRCNRRGRVVTGVYFSFPFCDTISSSVPLPNRHALDRKIEHPGGKNFDDGTVMVPAGRSSLHAALALSLFSFLIISRASAATDLRKSLEGMTQAEWEAAFYRLYTIVCQNLGLPPQPRPALSLEEKLKAAGLI